MLSPFRTFLALMVSALGVIGALAGLAAIGSPFGNAADGVGGVVVAPGSSTDTEVAAPRSVGALNVRILTPASISPGATRQLRLQVHGGDARSLSATSATDRQQLLAVTFTIDGPTGDSGSVWIQPNRLLVDRSALTWTRLRLGASPDIPCGSELGALSVTVRDLSEDGPRGRATVALPPVTCLTPPPPAPASVHDTEPTCGGDLEPNPHAAWSPEAPECRIPPPRPARRPSPAPDPPADADDDPLEDDPEDLEDGDEDGGGAGDSNTADGDSNTADGDGSQGGGDGSPGGGDEPPGSADADQADDDAGPDADSTADVSGSSPDPGDPGDDSVDVDASDGPVTSG